MSDEYDIDHQPIPSFAKRMLIYSRDWLFAIALTLFGFWAISKWRAPDLPDMAPDFSLQTVTGESLSLSDFKGRTVVLNFWTTWCNFCKKDATNPGSRPFLAIPVPILRRQNTIK